MTDGKPRLGDIIRGRERRQDPQPAPSPSEMIAALAARFEVDPRELRDEIMGGGPLAHVFRCLFDIQRSKARRGRRPDVERSWREFLMINVIAASTRNTSTAIEKFVDYTGGDFSDEDRISAVQRRYSRSKKRWKNVTLPDGLAALYLPAPSQDLDE